MTSQLLLAVAVALLGQTTPVAGSIRGVVVNASQNGVPVGGAEVVLRVKLEGQFAVAAEGVADEQGRFVFDDIPADAEYTYLPGANLAGIHYPGPRVTLSATTPHARLKLAVHDPVTEPSPLVLRRHVITLQPEPGALRVTEKLLIENPSSRTYVGRPAREGGRAATLRLSIPPDFRRTTFHQEFYGRQFTLIDGRLVTDVPWPPGRRDVAFTYVLPNEERYGVWQRPLDLPCDYLRVEVQTDAADEIHCNLSRSASQSAGVVRFEATGPTLPAGYVVRLQIGRLPVPLATYGRWLALVVLIGLIATASLIGMRYRQGTRPQPAVRPASSTALSQPVE